MDIAKGNKIISVQTVVGSTLREASYIDDYQPHQVHSDEVRHECLKMYVDGMRFRA